MPKNSLWLREYKHTLLSLIRDDHNGNFGRGVAVLAGFQLLGNYNDLWTTYRATAEQLRHEKF